MCGLLVVIQKVNTFLGQCACCHSGPLNEAHQLVLMSNTPSVISVPSSPEPHVPGEWNRSGDLTEDPLVLDEVDVIDLTVKIEEDASLLNLGEDLPDYEDKDVPQYYSELSH